MLPHLRRLFLLTCLATMVLVASPAFGQRRIEGRRVGSGPLNVNPAGKALGSGSVNRPNGILGDGAMTYGNALDANLKVGSGGFNSRSARSEAYTYRNLQARNLVVTNGVAGGRGFRGDVGYVAPGDFAGRTSGDSTYAFRRDSALSGLEFLSSSRQVDTFNIAQGMGVFQYRRDYTSLPEVNSIQGVRRIEDAEIRLDRANAAIRTGNLLDTAVAPSNLGLVQAADGELERATSSTIRGIQFPRADQYQPDSIYEQSVFNRAQFFDDDAVMQGFAPEPFVTPLERMTQSESAANDARLESDASTAGQYEAILQRVLEKYEGRDDVSLDISGLQKFRRDLDRIDAAITPDRIGSEQTESVGTSDTRRPGLPGDRVVVPGLGVGPGDAIDDAFAAPAKTDAPDEEADGEGSRRSQDGGEEEDGVRSVEELLDALAHGEVIETLVDPKMRVRVQEIVTQAETAMMEGEYFQAEDRFEVALRLNPGNPMLEGGLANAQIGAGLYRSAGVTLSRLFRDHELMVDVDWEDGLIAKDTRLKVAVSEIESMIARRPESAGTLGLVLAYIGRQLGDRDLIEQGLDRIDDAKLQPLVPLLRGVWLSAE